MVFDLPGVKPGSELESLFKAVGFVAIQWGFSEQSLDLMVASIFHTFDGHPLAKRRPQNLEAKVDFLRKCFTGIPKLTQFAAEGDAYSGDFPRSQRNETTLCTGPLQIPPRKLAHSHF